MSNVYWYNAGANANWATTTGNWWDDAAHTIQHKIGGVDAIPIAGDSVYLLGDTYPDTPPVAPNNSFVLFDASAADVGTGYLTAVTTAAIVVTGTLVIRGPYPLVPNPDFLLPETWHVWAGDASAASVNNLYGIIALGDGSSIGENATISAIIKILGGDTATIGDFATFMLQLIDFENSPDTLFLDTFENFGTFYIGVNTTWDNYCLTCDLGSVSIFGDEGVFTGSSITNLGSITFGDDTTMNSATIIINGISLIKSGIASGNTNIVVGNPTIEVDSDGLTIGTNTDEKKFIWDSTGSLGVNITYPYARSITFDGIQVILRKDLRIITPNGQQQDQPWLVFLNNPSWVLSSPHINLILATYDGTQFPRTWETSPNRTHHRVV